MSFSFDVKNECVSERNVRVVHYNPGEQASVVLQFQDVETFTFNTAEEYLVVTVDPTQGEPLHEIILPSIAFTNFSPSESGGLQILRSPVDNRTVITIPEGAAANWELKVMMPPSDLFANAAGENDNVTVSDDGG